MKIHSLYIKNFRGIEDIKLNMDGKSAVIFGINGTGKTTILDVCDILFYRLLGFSILPMLNTGEELKLLDKDIKLETNDTELFIELEVDGQSWRYARNYKDGKRTHSNHERRSFQEFFQEKYIGKEVMEQDEELEDGKEPTRRIAFNAQGVPIYSTYGIRRYVIDEIQDLSERAVYTGKMEAWEQMFNSTINFNLFFQWFRKRQEYENSIKVDNPEFVDSQLNTVKTAILRIMGDKFTDLKIRINDNNAQMIARKNGKDFSIAQLSEGEKCTLALAGDIARKLAIANPGSSNPLVGEGIVLIDEIDLHLHPTWQSKILPLLIEIFPNIQFVVTTHSPKVLGELDETVKIFQLEEKDGAIELQETGTLQGWDANEILSRFMDTDIIKKSTKDLIEEIYVCIENSDKESAKKKIEHLEELTDGYNLNVVRAKTMLRRMK